MRPVNKEPKSEDDEVEKENSQNLILLKTISVKEIESTSFQRKRLNR